MIGYARRLLTTHVLTPQAAVATVERRAVLLDSDTVELGIVAQQLDMAEVSSTPIPERTEIGGTLTISHVLSVAVNVQHGDRLEARRIRDLIVIDLVARATLQATRAAMLGTADTDTPAQRFDDLRWSVDYRPLVVSSPNENAVLVFTLDTVLDR